MNPVPETRLERYVKEMRLKLQALETKIKALSLEVRELAAEVEALVQAQQQRNAQLSSRGNRLRNRQKQAQSNILPGSSSALGSKDLTLKGSYEESTPQAGPSRNAGAEFVDQRDDDIRDDSGPSCDPNPSSAQPSCQSSPPLRFINILSSSFDHEYTADDAEASSDVEPSCEPERSAPLFITLAGPPLLFVRTFNTDPNFASGSGYGSDSEATLYDDDSDDDEEEWEEWEEGEEDGVDDISELVSLYRPFDASGSDSEVEFDSDTDSEAEFYGDDMGDEDIREGRGSGRGNWNSTSRLWFTPCRS